MNKFALNVDLDSKLTQIYDTRKIYMSSTHSSKSGI